jgi:hypothetical protein
LVSWQLGGGQELVSWQFGGGQELVSWQFGGGQELVSWQFGGGHWSGWYWSQAAAVKLTNGPLPPE